MITCCSVKSLSVTIRAKKTGSAAAPLPSSTKTLQRLWPHRHFDRQRGYATGYKYDAFNLYVATATNPLNQQTQYLYNYSNGKAKQTTDPNNRITKNIYDGVGRLVEVDQSDVTNPHSLATSTTYQFTDNTATPSIVHRADYLTATNTVDTYDYYDGLNRLVQERKASQTAGTYVALDRLYNPVGLLGSTSLPYFSSGSGFTSPTSITALYTTYTYDPLKRALITSNAVGSTKNAYAKWTTTTTDPNRMIPVGDRPILWHLMDYYSQYGHKDFVLCLGYKANVIKNFFLKHEPQTYADCVVSGGGQRSRFSAKCKPIGGSR